MFKNNRKKISFMFLVGIVLCFGVANSDDVKRVEVALYTQHPKAGTPIFFTASSRLPDFLNDGDGYFCCFPGVERKSSESWEYNAARGFNGKTFYFFAQKFDKNKELFNRRLYSQDAKVREEYQRKANELIADKLKNAQFMQINKFSRLYFLYVPYKDFYKEMRAQFVHNQRLDVIKRFGEDSFIKQITENRVIMRDSIRPGKYFNWIEQLPMRGDMLAKQAFNGSKLWFSPYALHPIQIFSMLR